MTIKPFDGLQFIVTILLFIVSAWAIYASAEWFYSWNDSDAPNRKSGLVVYRDHLTGCEYIGRPFGSLLPRTDVNGKQVCRAPVIKKQRQHM